MRAKTVVAVMFPVTLTLRAPEAQLKTATDDAGLWRFQNGAAIYAHKLKQFTTTNMTAAEIHELGLREVRRIEGDMDAILRKLGRTEGTVKDRMQKLAADLSYPLTNEGRTRIMADIDAMIRDADARSNALFDVRPTEDSVEPIDLRLYLRIDGRPLTETWIYQWTPPPPKERKAAIQ